MNSSAGVTGHPLVVGETGAVGGADLDQPSARLGHHVGDAEAAADLDELTSRHGHVTVPCERRQHEQHRSRTVVHHVRGLGTAGASEESSGVHRTRPPLAGGEVELEVGGRCGDVDPERCPAQVGVEQHAGGVDDRLQQRSTHRLGSLAGMLVLPVGDGCPGHLDQERVGQTGVGERSGQHVDRRWPHRLEG